MNTRVYVLGKSLTNIKPLPLLHPRSDTLIVVVDATEEGDWNLEVYFWTRPIGHKLTFDDLKEPLEQCFDEIRVTHEGLSFAYAESDFMGVEDLQKLCDMRDEIIRRIKERIDSETLEPSTCLFDEPLTKITCAYTDVFGLFCRLY